jgi:hypothetical protein
MFLCLYAHVILNGAAVDALLVDNSGDPDFWPFPYTLQHTYRPSHCRPSDHGPCHRSSSYDLVTKTCSCQSSASSLLSYHLAYLKPDAGLVFRLFGIDLVASFHCRKDVSYPKQNVMLLT